MQQNAVGFADDDLPPAIGQQLLCASPDSLENHCHAIMTQASVSSQGDLEEHHALMTVRMAMTIPDVDEAQQTGTGGTAGHLKKNPDIERLP